jgi:hypothetical protein
MVCAAIEGCAAAADSMQQDKTILRRRLDSRFPPAEVPVLVFAHLVCSPFHGCKRFCDSVIGAGRATSDTKQAAPATTAQPENEPASCLDQHSGECRPSARVRCSNSRESKAPFHLFRNIVLYESYFSNTYRSE